MKKIRTKLLVVTFGFIVLLSTIYTGPFSLSSVLVQRTWLGSTQGLRPQDFASLHSSKLSSLPLPPTPPPLETVAIIVENSLYSNISVQVTQYRLDLNNSGYHTILYTLPLSTPQELRGNLTFWYMTYNLSGAVLIGRLPYAQFYHPSWLSGNKTVSAETFICDLYLMDLDGLWWDVDPANGIYEKHNASLGTDIYPEIFIGRIDPQALGGSPTTNINNYLSRLHNYRTGGLQRQRRALVYIDDDWTGYWGNLWNSDVGLAYPTKTYIHTPTTWTNATDWRTNRLTLDYQWTHLCVHSTALAHSFGPGGGGGEGSVSSNQIAAIPPAFNFYNLFACHAADWTIINNLGVTYAFSGPNSLAVIGSTKTGGMMDTDDFYGPLGQNKTLGESLLYWFSQSLHTGSTAGANYLEWYYGMNIIGDPFLTTYYDCTVLPPEVFSLTHPFQSAWDENALPLFNWTIPVDVNGISGYYYCLDQNPTTVPNASSGIFTTLNGIQITTPLTDGTWYLHLIARDTLGNIGQIATHYQVNIDRTNPTVNLLVPSNGATLFRGLIPLIWSANDTESGYQFSEIRVDGVLIKTLQEPVTTSNVTILTDGTHTINITVYNWAGLSNSDQISVNIIGVLPIPGYSWYSLLVGLVAGLFFTFWRKRRTPNSLL